MDNRRRDRRLRALRRTTKQPERCFISRHVSFEPASNRLKDRSRGSCAGVPAHKPEFAQRCRANAG